MGVLRGRCGVWCDFIGRGQGCQGYNGARPHQTERRADWAWRQPFPWLGRRRTGYSGFLRGLPRRLPEATAGRDFTQK